MLARYAVALVFLAPVFAVAATAHSAAPRHQLITKHVRQGGFDNGWNKITHLIWADTVKGTAVVNGWNASTNQFVPWTKTQPPTAPPVSGKRAPGRLQLHVVAVQQGGPSDGWVKLSHFVWIDTHEGTARVFGWNAQKSLFNPWDKTKEPQATKGPGASEPGRYQLEILAAQQGNRSEGWAKLTTFIWTDTKTGKVEVFVWNETAGSFKKWQKTQVPPPPK